jgi:hypothetical protein
VNQGGILTQRGEKRLKEAGDYGFMVTTILPMVAEHDGASPRNPNEEVKPNPDDGLKFTVGRSIPLCRWNPNCICSTHLLKYPKEESDV